MMYYLLFAKKLSKNELDNWFKEVQVSAGFFITEVKAAIKPDYKIEYISIPSTFFPRQCDPVITLVEAEVYNPPEWIFGSTTPPTENEINEVLNKLSKLPFLIDLIISVRKPTQEDIIRRLLDKGIISKKSDSISNVLRNLFTQSEPRVVRDVVTTIQNTGVNIAAGTNDTLKKYLPLLLIAGALAVVLILRR